jgi:hypothetical protein
MNVLVPYMLNENQWVSDAIMTYLHLQSRTGDSRPPSSTPVWVLPLRLELGSSSPSQLGESPSALVRSELRIPGCHMQSSMSYSREESNLGDSTRPRPRFRELFKRGRRPRRIEKRRSVDAHCRLVRVKCDRII